MDGDAGEVRALPRVGDDVLDLEGGVGRQDDVGIEAVVLQPGMLRDDALDLASCIASMVQLPWFQQVMRQGVSVQIMWMGMPPFSFAMG